MLRRVYVDTFRTGYNRRKKSDRLECIETSLTDSGFWQQIDGKWEWMSKRCANLTPFLKDSEVTQCLATKYQGGHTVVGDSHMRYLHFYLTDITYPSIEYTKGRLKGRDHQVGNAYYIKNTHPQSLIQNVLASKKRKHSYNNISVDRSYTVLDSGAWVLASQNISSLIVYMTEVFKELNNLKTNNSRDYPEIFRNPIFWQTIPAFRPYHPDLNFKGNRNNFAIAAVNSWAQIHLENLGIIVIDLFTLSRTMEHMRGCGDHYLCHPSSKENQDMYGTAGITAAKMIFHKLCT